MRRVMFNRIYLCPDGFTIDLGNKKISIQLRNIFKNIQALTQLLPIGMAIGGTQVAAYIKHDVLNSKHLTFDEKTHYRVDFLSGLW